MLNQQLVEIKDSVTLALNAMAIRLGQEGKTIYNLTAGRLPFFPPESLVKGLVDETRFIKSYQYTPAAGLEDVKAKFKDFLISKRSSLCAESLKKLSSICSSGGKQSLFNAFGALLNPGDKVLLLAPYWLSYEAMTLFWKGQVEKVTCESFEGFIPSLGAIEESLKKGIKLIVLNSPCNPTGVSYSREWMIKFAEIISRYPDTWVFSDEIYHQLYYFDPRPEYFYEFAPELLNRTIIFDGISKSLAATGLRLGVAHGPNEVIKLMSQFQAQTTSNPNSHTQLGFLNTNLDQLDDYLNPIRQHLRENAHILKEQLAAIHMDHAWYQTNSAFYFTLDFSLFPSQKTLLSDGQDHAPEICKKLMEQRGVVIVPTSDFGKPNAARISLVAEPSVFLTAVTELLSFLKA